ncbi:hypothetical protein [Streptomyces sp. NRRL WC-3742]|uniref:hypothetical protein n=1 Tax=Streptomyces sp. NRRL WC-3742 TaxID=1463934 RepID=UPI0004C489F1|nr:hypothetical protein [Streptomyces sp. NRRL WC-3742]
MDPVYTLAWRHGAGLVPPEDLPMAAADLLVAGEDSPALRDLAGRARSESPAELIGLLSAALAELGVVEPGYGISWRCHVWEAAECVATGGLAPEELVENFWHDAEVDATEAERQFAAHYTEVDCTSCLACMSAEQVTAWAESTRAAAGAVVAAADDPRVAPPRGL